MNARDRLIEFLKYLGIGQTAFEEKVGIARSYISHNKGSIGTGIIRKISFTYPELNTNWLITGEGDMLNNDFPSAISKEPITKYGVHDENQNRDVTINKNLKGIRYHENLDASAGNVGMFDDEKENNGSMIWIPGFEDCTDAINVWGDSMYPVLKSGEIIILKEWRESFIDYGKIYLVITKNGKHSFLVKDGITVAYKPAFRLFKKFKFYGK